ncbi:Prefoldin alpha subunit [Atractiella rhizophila]|nr:Prefoldin alpha subunit [Atractiella rhizophila]
MADQEGVQSVPIQALGVEQLAALKSQLDQEIAVLSQSFSSLRLALGRFQSCVSSLDTLNEGNKDKTVLVPLTSSLYVPGKLSDVEEVLMDVGTGYYVSKPVKSAKTSYEARIKELKQSLEELQPQIERKEDNRALVVKELQEKLSKREREREKEEKKKRK